MFKKCRKSKGAFHRAASLSKLPLNKAHSVNIDGRKLILLKVSDNEVFALDLYCYRKSSGDILTMQWEGQGMTMGEGGAKVDSKKMTPSFGAEAVIGRWY